MKRIAGLALAGAFLALGACTEAPTAPQYLEGGEAVEERRGDRPLRPAASPTIVDVALSVNEETGEFSTLIAAVVEAELVDDLSARGQRTVFAPTDAAFEALGLTADNIGDALDDDTLREILLYHVANGRRDAAEVTSSDQIRMLNGGFNDITVNDMGAFIGEAKIIQTDVEASNGIIHVIDAVLLPSTDDDEPSDDDEGDDNGDDEGDDEGDDDGEMTRSETLVDVALAVNAETGEFSTLIAALVETDLVEALSGDGQWTVFAPTDAAFSALGLTADNIGDALDDDTLRNILLYHVANGRRDAGEVTSSDRIRMLNGDFNEVTVGDMGAFIGEAKIIQTDVEASNGIIHVIDGVLLPPTDDEDEDDEDDEDDD